MGKYIKYANHMCNNTELVWRHNPDASTTLAEWYIRWAHRDKIHCIWESILRLAWNNTPRSSAQSDAGEAYQRMQQRRTKTEKSTINTLAYIIIIIIIRSRRQQRTVASTGQPRVATTTSLGPFSTNAEGCTVADLLDPWMARASWPSPPTRTKTGAGSCCCDLW